MADSGKSEKKANPIVQAWLIMYNVAMTAGWLAMAIGVAMHFWKHKTHKGLYTQMQKQILFFQTCALMEILHAAFGFVRSSAVLTTMQVFSRTALLWFVVEPIFQVQDCDGVAMFLIAWVLIEIVRYSFYTFHLLGSTPYIITWLRYTLFIFLYPLGVMGEMLTVYRSLPYVQNDKIYSITLPNAANFAFDYYTFLILGVFPMYCTGFPQLYLHMFSLRKKVLSCSKTESGVKKNE